MENQRLSFYQILVIILTVFIFLFDGFDIAVITFASNPLSDYFQLDDAGLGLLLGLDYVGVVLGSLLIAPLSDKYGRRPVLLVSLLVLAIGLYLTSTATNVYLFGAYRQLTGLAAGAIIPIALALGSELVNTPKQKNITVAILTFAGPLGGIIAGAATNILSPQYGWQGIFVFGAIMLGIISLLSIFLLPESVEFLSKRRNAGDLEKANAIRFRMKQPTLTESPIVENKEEKVGVKNILSPTFLKWSVLLWTVFFLLNVGLQFIFKWTPKIMVKGGMAEADAVKITMGLILGGVLGVLFMGSLSNRFPLRKLTPISFAFGAGMAFLYGSIGYGFGLSMALAFTIGISLQACYVGLNLSAIKIYDTQSRSTGTGWMMGIGKIGGIFGPMIAGGLFAAGFGRLAVIALVFMLPFLLGAIAYSFIDAKAVREVSK